MGLKSLRWLLSSLRRQQILVSYRIWVSLTNRLEIHTLYFTINTSIRRVSGAIGIKMRLCSQRELRSWWWHLKTKVNQMCWVWLLRLQRYVETLIYIFKHAWDSCTRFCTGWGSDSFGPGILICTHVASLLDGVFSRLGLWYFLIIPSMFIE